VLALVTIQYNGNVFVANPACVLVSLKSAGGYFASGFAARIRRLKMSKHNRNRRGKFKPTKHQLRVEEEETRTMKMKPQSEMNASVSASETEETKIDETLRKMLRDVRQRNRAFKRQEPAMCRRVRAEHGHETDRIIRALRIERDILLLSLRSFSCIMQKNELK
jgi:hypothetical protein